MKYRILAIRRVKDLPYTYDVDYQEIKMFGRVGKTFTNIRTTTASRIEGVVVNTDEIMFNFMKVASNHPEDFTSFKDPKPIVRTSCGRAIY